MSSLVTVGIIKHAQADNLHVDAGRGATMHLSASQDDHQTGHSIEGTNSSLDAGTGHANL